MNWKFWQKQEAPVPAPEPPKQNRQDGWINPVTGLGVSTLDKSVSAYFIKDNRLTDQELSDLYHFDDISIKIVRLRPEEMFRVGYNVTVRADDSEDTKDTTKKSKLKEDVVEEDDAPDSTSGDDDGVSLRKLADNIELDSKVLEAMCLGRAYGGAILFIGSVKGRPDQPLDEEEPGDVKFLTVFDRREIHASTFYSDPLAPNFGMPETYTIYPQFFTGQYGESMKSGITVHESRCVRFEGTHADRRTRAQLRSWTYSVLQPVYHVVRDFEQLFRSMGYMVQDANQSVFKLSGLIDQISNNPESLKARMQIVENTRAVNRAVLLDVDEQEDFMKVNTTFSGVPEVADRFMQRLSSAADIPVAQLMGRSAAGMNATGEADLTAFYNSVAREQENKLKPILLKLYKMLARAKGIDPDSVVIQFRPLTELTEKERAELELAHAQKDKLYADSGVLTPEEIALSRFSDPEEFGLRIQLNKASLDARRESLELALENPDFSGTNEATGLGPDGKPLPMPAGPGGGAGGSQAPGQKGAGIKTPGQAGKVARGSTGTSGPPRSNTKT